MYWYVHVEQRKIFDSDFPSRKWNLTLVVYQNTGKENRIIAIENFFAILISTMGRFNRANKKICHIHLKVSQLLNRALYVFLCMLYFYLLSEKNILYVYDTKTSTSQVTQQDEAYPGFSSMKRLGMLVHRRVTLPVYTRCNDTRLWHCVVTLTCVIYDMFILVV